VSFNYGTIKWTYTQQKRTDGSGGGNVTGGWSLVENKVSA
jgi:type VI secretion system secreted protein Hcp